MSVANLVFPDPWQAIPTRSCEGGVGNPVDVSTGNMYFDHTDIVIPGVGPAIELKRSYNSRDAYAGIGGTFGPGWSSSYEQRITVPAANFLKLTGADGQPMYFTKTFPEVIYRATAPATETSWIESLPAQYTRHFVDGRREIYGASGALSAYTDPVGNQTTITRDGNGRIDYITNGNRVLDFEYDGTSTRIESISGPMGLIAEYIYDPLNRLETVSYSDGSGYTFGYNATHQIETVTDASGVILETHEYIGDKARTSELSDGQERFELEYFPGKTKVTDARGNITTYWWTGVWGRNAITRIEGPCGSCGGSGAEVSEWTYDAKGRIETHTTGVGSEAATVRYEYDPVTGQLSEEERELGHTTGYAYWPDRRLNTITAPNGMVTTYTYVAAGIDTVTVTAEPPPAPPRLVADLDYTPLGQVWKVTDARGKVTEFIYDSFDGDLETMIDPLGTETPTPGDHEWHYEHDALGRRTAVVDPLGHRVETPYYPRGQIERIRKFDGTTPIDTSFTYDLGGRLESITDPLNRITNFEYDDYGRLWKRIEPDDPEWLVRPETIFAYDDMSNLSSITDAEGRLTEFTWDSYNRLTSVKEPGPVRPIEVFTYDSHGRIRTRTRPNITTTYDHDLLGRLVTRTFSDGSPSFTFVYDENGDKGFLTSANHDGFTLAWDYDLLGQRRTETSAFPSGPTTVVEYSYDLAGNRESMKINGAPWLTYSYDSANRLDWMSRGGALFDFAYDAAHRRASLSFPNSAAISYGYDDLNRQLSVIHSTSPVTSSIYTYDDAGNRETKTHPMHVESYQYDSYDRLRHALVDGIPKEDFSYDRVGNRNTDPASWVYNSRNELLSGAGLTFTYSRGHMETRSDGTNTWSYEWDAENRLTRVLRNGLEIARYFYDAMGRRVERRVGSATHRYTYDGEDILIRTVDQGLGSTAHTYVHGPGIDEPLAADNGNGLERFFHADGLGSIIATSLPSGAVEEKWVYSTFGVSGVITDDVYGFTGREWDAETGLYYYRFRYYDPEIGRFVSEDPINWRSGVNFYAYVDNNPTTLIDPAGLKKCVGLTRVLAGNPGLIGKQGGIPGVTVAGGTAAVIPTQFGAATGGQLAANAGSISGGIPTELGTIPVFNGVTDVIGSTQIPAGFKNIRDYLEATYPGQTIIEVPDGRDMGSIQLELNVPDGVPCPPGSYDPSSGTCGP